MVNRETHNKSNQREGGGQKKKKKHRIFNPCDKRKHDFAARIGT